MPCTGITSIHAFNHFNILEVILWRSFHVDLRELHPCTKKFRGLRTSFSSIPCKDVLFSDIRFTRKLLCSRKSLKKINSYNLFGKPVTYVEYKRIIMRLLSNPTSDVSKIIIQYRNQLGDLNNLLGVHVRCGGSFADTKEKKVILKSSTFDQIPGLIRSLVNNDTTIFLSTDSSRMEKLIRKRFPIERLFTVSTFSRGHTTAGHVSGSAIKRAILDMYLVAQADTIIYTQKSGFSNLCVSLSNANSLYEIPSYL